jgi:hypothetical protein
MAKVFIPYGTTEGQTAAPAAAPPVLRQTLPEIHRRGFGVAADVDTVRLHRLATC